MLNQRFILACVLLFFHTLLFAETYQGTTVFSEQKKHWYASANVGLYQGIFNQKYDDTTDLFPQSVATSVLQNGYLLGFAVGYGKVICNVYSLGAELTGNFLFGNAQFNMGAASTIFTDTTKAKGNVDLLFVPGILLTETMVAYAKLGISLGFFNDSLSSPAGFVVVNNTYTSNRTAFGFAAGLGVRRYFCLNGFVFAEYNYHDYGSFGFKNFTNFTATYSHSAHIYSNSLGLGFGYHFA